VEGLLRVTVWKFGLLTHIEDTSLPDPHTDHWNKADFYVCSWLYGSVFDVVLDFTMVPDQTARDLWACDNPPRKVLYYRLRPIHFGH
jgi:hypothetical protein